MKRSVKILWRVFLSGLGLFILMLLCANWGLFGKMPSVAELENPEADLASEVYSSDGVLMGKFYAENRSEVKYNEISPNVVNALLATEDERFYDHSGIDASAPWATSRPTSRRASRTLHEHPGHQVEYRTIEPEHG